MLQNSPSPSYIVPQFPRRLRASVSLPASKSISARALILHHLCGAARHGLSGLSTCDDTVVMRRALVSRPYEVDIMAAGTAMRFLTAYFSVMPGESHLLTGTERMRHRPIALLVDALRSLGADIAYAGEEGFPPLLVRGRELRGGRVELPADVSSQYVSALLLVAPCLSDGLRLRLRGTILSRPYIDMTIALMRRYGAQAEWSAPDEITVAPRPYTGADLSIEPDWSAASYWYEMVALSDDPEARVELKDFARESVQGDSRVAEMFRPLGVATEYVDAGIVLTKCVPGAADEVLRYDFSAVPDIAQTLVVTCAMLGRPFEFTGLQSLRIKETDRITALQNELQKLGIRITAGAADLSFRPDPSAPSVAPSGVAIDTYQDHRMAMAFAPCALCRPGFRVNCPEVVSKSYPAFWDDLAALKR